MANLHSHREIDLINVFCVILDNDNVQSDDGAEIKQYQARPDFLLNVLRLFGMEVDSTDDVLKVSERCFYTPAQVVQLHEHIGWELIRGEVSDNIFKDALSDLETDNSEGKWVFIARVRHDIVKLDRLADISVLVGKIRAAPFLNRMGTSQNDVHTGINTIRERVKLEKTGDIAIFRPNKEKGAFFDNVSKYVVGSEAPVGNKDGEGGIVIPIREVAKSAELIFFHTRLKDAIQISFAEKIVQGNSVEGVEAHLGMSAGRVEGIRVFRVSEEAELATIATRKNVFVLE